MPSIFTPRLVLDFDLILFKYCENYKDGWKFFWTSDSQFKSSKAGLRVCFRVLAVKSAIMQVLRWLVSRSGYAFEYVFLF